MRATTAITTLIKGCALNIFIKDFLSLMLAEIPGHKFLLSGTPRRAMFSSASFMRLFFILRSFPISRANVRALHSASTSLFQLPSLIRPPFPFHSYPRNIFERSRPVDVATTFALPPRFDFGLQWTRLAIQETQLGQSIAKTLRPHHLLLQPAARTFALPSLTHWPHSA